MSDKKILRVLVIDDSPDDTELTLTTLRKNGDFMLKSHRVQDLASFQSAIEKNEWDVILSEYTLPHFGAAVAHDVLRRADIAVPFLVVTRAIRDADIVKIMRAGAQDVIVKGQLARLVPAIERELTVAAERREYRAATQTLKEVENKHRAIVEGSREAMCYSQDGMHVDANRAYLDIFEYQEFSELEGIPVMNLIDKSDQPRFKEFMRKHRDGGGAPQEFVALRKSGAKLHVEVTLSPITINGEQCTQLLITDVSKRKAVETKLQYLNQHDPLTGLYNRAYITQELAKAIEQAKAGGKHSGAIYIDFHELKHVHNMLGHAAADRFLLKAVKVLREALGNSVTLARFGDHEFVALLIDVDERMLTDRGARVDKALKNTTFTDGGHTVDCAFRIASAPINAAAENSQKLLASMYRAAAPAEPPKPAATAAPAAAPASPPAASTPTPAATPVTPAAAPAAAARKGPGDWHDRIEHALQHDGFQLTYQPIISLHGDSAEYFEVLVRMTGRNNELIAAGEFMPPAEQSGQAVAIDRWVVKQSVQALADLVAEGRQPIFFVNLCAAAITDEQLLTVLEAALKQYKANAQSLVFEIDEPAIVGKPKEAASFLRTLKRIGAKFCVDNFGKSMGALDYLRDLPVDYLKIDAALVRNISRDPVNQASFKAVLEVAKSLEKKTIAKGVESAEILSSLWTFGVDYAQGNYFQQADAATDYEFSGETTLSSDISVPQWATAQTKSQSKTR
ncbi:MAG: EAL domain-containing protein [Gammaproteobacteria bacterium]